MSPFQDGLRALLPNVKVSFGSNSGMPAQLHLQRKLNFPGHERIPHNSTGRIINERGSSKLFDRFFENRYM